MGNRAVVTTKTAAGFCENAMGLYVHWNGGKDSITAFLKYCEMQGFKSPEVDSKSWQRMQQVILNYNEGLSTVTVDICKNLDCDNMDNGVYMIENWQIVGRKFMNHKEQEEYPLKEMLLSIDEKQPKFMQIHDKILMEFATANKIIMDMCGDAETGYRVVKILICDGQRHYSTIYHDSDYGKCLEWMNAFAAKNGFRYDGENAKTWIKTA